MDPRTNTPVLADVLARLAAASEELRAHGVSRLSVFGSVARGEASPTSDIDLLAEFVRPPGLLSLVRLERRLAEILRHRVDLVTPGGLRGQAREVVLAEAVRAA